MASQANTKNDAHYHVRDPASKVSMEILTGPHQSILRQGVSNVLSCEASQATYSQILDGAPLWDALLDSYKDGLVVRDHPLKAHNVLCEGVSERMQQLKGEFRLESLRFDSRLLYEYQAAADGSRAFNLRLIELVAIAVHQIAVQIARLDSGCHNNDPMLSWIPLEDDDRFPLWNIYHPDGPPPTWFRHQWYRDYEQYPEGIADGIGYWAEARILGGVVLFDRRDPDSAPRGDGAYPPYYPDAVYFHSDRYEVTYRIYQLLDSQKQELLRFIRSEDASNCPLPIIGDEKNTHRIDPEDPIKETGIYRDIWERRPRPGYEMDGRIRDVTDHLNYTSFDEWDESRGRGYDWNSRRHLYSEDNPYDPDPNIQF